jgi:hypothetical protein
MPKAKEAEAVGNGEVGVAAKRHKRRKKRNVKKEQEGTEVTERDGAVTEPLGYLSFLLLIILSGSFFASFVPFCG